MPKLELLASGPGTGKTTYCIDLFRKEILKSPGGLDSRSYFVLPNREHAGRIQNLVLKKGTPGLFNVHLLTIQDLAERFSAGQPLPRPGESFRRILLRRILEDPEASWQYFSSVKDLAGFHALLSERIQELNSATMSVAELERRAQPLLKDKVFRAKFRDFSVVVKRYGEELEKRGLAEAEYSLEALSEAVTERAAAQLVILDGFYHFSQAQKVLILALAKRVQRMVATLTLPDSAGERSHVFELVESTRRFLTRAGFKPSAAGFSKNHRAGNAALKHLEKNLFLPEAKPLVSAQDAVRVLEAETPREEVEGIAREILKLHRETDWHFSDMALILRSVQGYEKWIGPVFAEYGIPVHIHERGRTIQTGVGRFAHRLAGLFLSGWRDRDLFSLLKSGYLPAPPDPEAVARFERLSYAKNTLSDRTAFLDLAKEAALPGIAETLAILAEWQDALLGAGSARVFRKRFTERLRDCRVREEDGAALAAVEGLLQRAAKLYPPDAGFPAVHALEEFQRALETGLFSQKPSGKNRVQVYDAVMALPKEYRAVFVAGLLDQVFPKTAAEDALFKDDERETMNGRDSRLEERRARRAGERYFFYMAVTRARELVTLSYPKKDQDARPLLPSAFVEEVRRCFRVLPAVREKEARWFSPGQAERELASALFSPPDAGTRKRMSALAARWRTRKRFAGILEAGGRDLQGRLGDPRTLAALAEQATVFSATRLEVFLTCAFRYFAENELKLKPAFEDRRRAEMGTLLHAVLERFYQEKNPDASALLESLFVESPLANEPLYRQRFLLRRLRRTLERFLRVEKEDPERSALTPRHFELEFGKKSDGSAAAWPYLSFGKGGVKLGGKIDRIDLTPEGKALVIDYKLGRRNLNKKLKQGLEVQLPIYMMAARRLLGLEILGAELRFLESGEKAGIEEAAVEELMRETEKKIVEAASRLRGGDITVRSKDCKYCELDSLCRFEKWKQVYTEADDA